MELVALRRLQTKDRLLQWGVVNEQQCELCNRENETIEHLLFSCDYSSEIWSRLLQWQGINRVAMNWKDELNWACAYANGNGQTSTIFRMTFAAAVYQVWIERNQKIFQAKHCEPKMVVRRIVQDIFYRGSLKKKLARRLNSLNFYP
ncbi:hypothetical protein KY284_000694 [Solanum tuberosum]|nr:hypothetical protein KY284_000694 [Solanum tuberosum]